MKTQTIRPIVDKLLAWLNGQRRTLSPKSETAKAMDNGLKRLPASTRFLDDGRICLLNNAAKRVNRVVWPVGTNATHSGFGAAQHII